MSILLCTAAEETSYLNFYINPSLMFYIRYCNSSDDGFAYTCLLDYIVTAVAMIRRNHLSTGNSGYLHETILHQ